MSYKCKNHFFRHKVEILFYKNVFILNINNINIYKILLHIEKRKIQKNKKRYFNFVQRKDSIETRRTTFIIRFFSIYY